MTAAADAACYAPYSVTRFQGVIMDEKSPVPDVCSGGFASSPNTVLRVSAAVLAASPACSLRFTIAPEVPLRWLEVQLLDANGSVPIGWLAPISASPQSLPGAGIVWSWCLGFNGTYTLSRPRLPPPWDRGAEGTPPTGGSGSRVVQRAKRYRLRVIGVGPLPAADAALGRSPRREAVSIRGVLLITA